MRNLDTWLAATIGAAQNITPTVREIRIDCSGIGHCAPGAHVNVRVYIDGQPDHRSYSILRHDEGDSIYIGVKAQTESRGGSAYMWSLEPGSRVHVTPAACDFELDLGRPHYLLIAGGIGVTPILSMARVLSQRNANVRMLYGARSQEEFAFADELQQLLGHRVEFLAADQGQQMQLAAEIAALPAGAELYVCGPFGLMEAVKEAWLQSGRLPSHLHFETFGSSGRYANQPFVVRVPRLGLEVQVPKNKSMLDALGEAGMEVLFDCRRGECGLCAVDILELDGDLDHRDVFFSAHQHEKNERMCCCVSRVVGGMITVDASFREDPVLR